jgi:hypothetical protein
VTLLVGADRTSASAGMVGSLAAAGPAGLTASRRTALLGMEARRSISHFCDEARLDPVGEERADIGLSSDPAIGGRQLEGRRARRTGAADLPSDAEAVMVLVEMVRRPDAEVEAQARVLGRRRHSGQPGPDPQASGTPRYGKRGDSGFGAVRALSEVPEQVTLSQRPTNLFPEQRAVRLATCLRTAYSVGLLTNGVTGA